MLGAVKANKYKNIYVYIQAHCLYYQGRGEEVMRRASDFERVFILFIYCSLQRT